MNSSMLLALAVAVLVYAAVSQTEFDNSFKPVAEKPAASKTQKSVADIVARATGKLDKSKAKQAAADIKKDTKREYFTL
jgi:cobalamin biosynthesis protein CobD/CbiB